MKTISAITFVLSVFIIFISCEKSDKTDENDSQASSAISESDVIGFYTGRGLYNAGNATIELYYGGSFEMEDPFLPDGGPAFGKWALRGNSIDFYMDGQKTFSAELSAGKKVRTIYNNNSNDEKVRGLIIKGQLWKKVR